MSRLGLEMNIREPAEPCVNLLLRSLAQKWKKRHLTLKVFLPSIYLLLSDLFLTNVQSVNNNDIYGLSFEKETGYKIHSNSNRLVNRKTREELSIFRVYSQQ